MKPFVMIPKIKKALLVPFSNQKGQSIVIFAFAILGLIAMLGLALDLGLVYIERTRLKRAVDAATLSAVSELAHEEKAYLRAIGFLNENGYNLRDAGGTPLINVYVRGCAHDGYLTGNNFANYHESNPGALLWTPAWSQNPNHPDLGDASTVDDLDKYYLYFPAGGTQVADPDAEFFIDTRTYQSKKSDGTYENDSQLCDAANDIFGSADKILVEGVVPVGMNFMQFFGFGEVPVSDVAVAQNVSSLDVTVVFDVSGSMQFDTICFGCYEEYERTSNPNKGEPIASWENDLKEGGNFYYGHQYPNPEFIHPIPVDHLPDTNYLGGGSANLEYAPELQAVLSAPNNTNKGNLCFGRDSSNAPDAFQSVGGSDPRYFIILEAELYSLNTSILAGPFRQPGRGYWAIQHANWRTILDMADAMNYNQWTDDPDASYAIEASPVLPSYDRGSWVSHHPYVSWAIDGVVPFGHDYTLDEARNTPNDVPSLEYDFVTKNDWNGTSGDDTRIWIRSQRAGSWADTKTNLYWAVYDYNQLYNGPANGDVTHASITPLGTGQIEPISETGGGNGSTYGGADGHRWQWRSLTNGSTSLNLDDSTRYTLKIWAGSPAYDIDQIVIGNRNREDEIPKESGYQSDGPARYSSASFATPGSAFRQACNRCNPIYGLLVDQADCVPNADNGAFSVPADGYDQSDPVNNRLFGGYQPIRDAKEATKRFIGKLDPQFDQVGIVSYSTGMPNGGRVELRCRRFEGADGCFRGTNAVTYTEVLDTLEVLPPIGSTNIAGGMLRGLEMLGIAPDGGTLDNSCQKSNPLNTHCSRGGSAKRIMIVMTDGVANQQPNSFCDDVDLYPGSGSSAEQKAQDCVIHYGQIAANNNVTIYTIGLGNGVDSDLLETVAKLPGSDGEFFAAVSSAQLDEIFETILSSTTVRLIQ